MDFDSKNTTAQILTLRSMAIDKILEMRNTLRSNNPNEYKQSKNA